MSTYLFILGKDSELSIAELLSRYPKGKIGVIGDDFVVMNLSQTIDQAEFNKLGGVIKVGEVVSDSDKNNLSNELVMQLLDMHSDCKLNYGISVYGWSESNLRSLLIDMKKKMKERGVGSRFANQDFKNISTAQHKGLKKKGIEMIVANDGTKFVIAKVVAVQDIDSYSKRDFKKPYRDMKVGMLPPKLAQIMINLTGDVQAIWDPFCGGGVLIMEGLLMGHDMIASDINENTLGGADENIEWFKKEFNVKNTVSLYVHDATLPQRDVKFDAIVCEGYLGPPQKHLDSASSLKPIIDELDNLYVGFFEAIKEIGFKGPIVIAMPFFRVSDGAEVELKSTINKIEKIGFKLKTEPLKYARADQIVGRAIYQF